MTGNIYDLGYRGYDGPRLGRRHAIATLIRHSMRSVLGLGRTTRAKIMPLICIGLPAIIALVLVGIRAIAARGGFEDIPIIPGHDSMYTLVAVFPLLFVAAQAPELLGRDQRYRVLTLYFSRALRRTDYALAKLTALTIGVLTILLIPQLILSAGLVLLDTDVGAALRKEAEIMPAVLGSSLLIAFVTASFALAIASATRRRAYATAAIFGSFIIPGIVAAVVIGLAIGGAAQWIILLDIGAVLDGVNAWFFGVLPTSQPLLESGVSLETMMAAAVIIGLGSTAALVWRYLRIQA
jgi:ABC-2 type transport system permease protein